MTIYERKRYRFRLNDHLRGGNVVVRGLVDSWERVVARGGATSGEASVVQGPERRLAGGKRRGS